MNTTKEQIARLLFEYEDDKYAQEYPPPPDLDDCVELADKILKFIDRKEIRYATVATIWVTENEFEEIELYYDAISTSMESHRNTYCIQDFIMRTEELMDSAPNCPQIAYKMHNAIRQPRDYADEIVIAGE